MRAAGACPGTSRYHQINAGVGLAQCHTCTAVRSADSVPWGASPLQVNCQRITLPNFLLPLSSPLPHLLFLLAPLSLLIALVYWRGATSSHSWVCVGAQLILDLVHFKREKIAYFVHGRYVQPPTRLATNFDQTSQNVGGMRSRRRHCTVDAHTPVSKWTTFDAAQRLTGCTSSRLPTDRMAGEFHSVRARSAAVESGRLRGSHAARSSIWSACVGISVRRQGAMWCQRSGPSTKMRPFWGRIHGMPRTCSTDACTSGATAAHRNGARYCQYTKRRVQIWGLRVVVWWLHDDTRITIPRRGYFRLWYNEANNPNKNKNKKVLTDYFGTLHRYMT